MTGTVAETLAAVAIALAVIVGGAGVLLRRRAAPAAARGPRWRVAALILLQGAAGALLHLILFPPATAIRAGALIVATAGAPRSVEMGPFDSLVALPEAGAVDGAARVPDLATALRRHPGAARVRVVGQGLPPRDRAPLPAPVDFDPAPAPRGLIEVSSPRPAAPGGGVWVGGRVGRASAGVVELLDPAGAVVDRARAAPGQRFVLSAETRAAGLALFGLRLRDAAGVVVSEVAVPVETRDEARPRVVVLAGAPSPETKYLARWAQDAGVDLTLGLDLGAGTGLGDASVSRAALDEADLLVIDDRRWEGLGPPARATIGAAVEGGLGVVLRPTGPLSAATRRDWASLGAPLSGDGRGRPSRLGSGAPETETALERLDLRLEGPEPVEVVRDASGAPLAAWRARGRGRIGVWTASDSYVLVLTGQADRHGRLWSGLFSALARPEAGSPIRVEGFPRAGTRVSLCGIADGVRVTAPSGEARALVVDPRTGPERCAAYWPEAAGWHVARGAQGGETAFYVHPAGAAPSLRAHEDRQATLAMVGAAAEGRATPARTERGSPWPWFAGLLIVLALLWWLERRRGRPPAPAG